MENLNNNTPITPESVLAAVKEMFAESRAAAEQSRANFDKDIEEIKRINRENAELIGGMESSNGEYAEEFFYNAFQQEKKNIFGEKYDEVMKKSIVTFNKGYEDEYDILLVNGQAVCLVEVKYKADSGDLPQKVLRKAQTFRVNFPRYNDKKLYLALASMSFSKLTEKACMENGIAIIKQVGNTVVINDKHLTVF